MTRGGFIWYNRSRRSIKDNLLIMTKKSKKTNNENKNSFEYEFQGVGLSVKEKHRGEDKFKLYRDNYHIETYSDLQLLEDLVTLEIYRENIKEQIGKVLENKKIQETNKFKTIPKHLTQTLDDNLKQILNLKQKLGLFSKDDTKDPFSVFRNLLYKFKKWLSNNQGTRTFPCPMCKKMIMLKIRTDKYDAIKHPFFKDKILTNNYLWKLYKEGKIEKLDVAKVLLGEEVKSTDYVDWLESKIYDNSSDKPTK